MRMFILKKTTALDELLFGVGVSIATLNGNYHHYPVCLIFPPGYVGYQLFSNRNDVSKFIKNVIK